MMTRSQRVFAVSLFVSAVDFLFVCLLPNRAYSFNFCLNWMVSSLCAFAIVSLTIGFEPIGSGTCPCTHSHALGFCIRRTPPSCLSLHLFHIYPSSPTYFLSSLTPRLSLSTSPSITFLSSRSHRFVVGPIYIRNSSISNGPSPTTPHSESTTTTTTTASTQKINRA